MSDDRWRDRDGWGSNRRRDEDDEDQRRRYGYGEAREYWRGSEPRYGERHRDERSSEYSSIPGLGTNYGGGWQNEYGQDWRRAAERGGTRGPWQQDDERSGSRYGNRYGADELRGSGYGSDRYGADDYRGSSSGGERYRGGGGYGGEGYGGRDSERGWWDRTKDEVRSWMGDQDAERRRQADHSGRGPKGYTRSDERIREDVSDRLMADWEVDATDVEVTVASGEVTLSGTVGDRQSKRRAEDIAANVLGVKDVQNSLRVRRVDPFATGREAASMNQPSASTQTTNTTGTSTGASTAGTSPGTSTGTSSQTPRH